MVLSEAIHIDINRKKHKPDGAERPMQIFLGLYII